MRKSIGLDSLAEEIQKLAQEKGQQVLQDAEQIIESTANNSVEEIRATAPRSASSGAHFADSFITEKLSSGVNTHFKIFSKDQWPITHLLEFGFVHYGKTGKYIKGRPFMLPAYNKAQAELIQKMREAIKK